MIYCCPDLEKLANPQAGGLGLVRITNKRGTRFLLLYQEDWDVPVAKAGTQIQFCPYYETKLSRPSLTDENSGTT